VTDLNLWPGPSLPLQALCVATLGQQWWRWGGRAGAVLPAVFLPPQ